MVTRRLKKEDLERELIAIGADPRSHFYFLRKSEVVIIKLHDVDARGANILKQEFLSAGGDVAVHMDVAGFRKDKTDCIVIGMPKTYATVLEKLEKEPYFGLKKVCQALKNALEEKTSGTMKIGGKVFDFQKDVYIMGILNVTPDSFSDGGKFLSVEDAFEHARQLIEEGADIIDIGGESTRPGAEAVDEQVEIERIIPVISKIREISDIPISVDTYKSSVARAALKNGADLVNDISGLRFDHEMVEVVREFSVPVVVMHIKGTPRDMQKNPQYSDLMKELLEYFDERISSLEKAGIEQLIIDPGIGFGKRYEDNLRIINNLHEFAAFGKPILIGASRKSFIGTALDGREVTERLYGTLAANAIAVLNGASIIRVHDIKPHRDLLKIIKAVKSG